MTELEIIKTIKRNEAVYFESSNIAKMLSDFAYSTSNAILEEAAKELDKIGYDCFRENQYLFKEFRYQQR